MTEQYSMDTIRQLKALQELCEKEELSEKENKKYQNLRTCLKKKGIPDLPYRKGKTRGRKPNCHLVKTMCDEVQEPQTEAPLYNCFKEVRPGVWERDGVNLTLQQAKETISDIKREGFKARFTPVSMGYVYKEMS